MNALKSLTFIVKYQCELHAFERIIAYFSISKDVLKTEFFSDFHILHIFYKMYQSFIMTVEDEKNFNKMFLHLNNI